MEDRERVELEGEREMQVEYCIGIDSNIEGRERRERGRG